MYFITMPSLMPFLINGSMEVFMNLKNLFLTIILIAIQISNTANALNKNYEMAQGYKTPGRLSTLGLTYSF